MVNCYEIYVLWQLAVFCNKSKNQQGLKLTQF